MPGFVTRSACRARLFAAGLALAIGSAQAAPDAGDGVARFLAERGLIETPRANAAAADPSLARQMRDRASDWASDLVLSAMNFLGVRYRRGGQSVEQGFDCSGFTRHVFEASIGLVLPRRSQEQAQAPGWLTIDRNELRPGDLVFFNTLRSAFSHVGIYVGEGKFIHSPRSGGQVRVEDMRVAYWSKRYNGARRAPASSDGTEPVASALLQPTALPPVGEPAAPRTTTPPSGGAGPVY
jgi:cell wall-associated NlpC family hydrolase